MREKTTHDPGRKGCHRLSGQFWASAPFVAHLPICAVGGSVLWMLFLWQWTGWGRGLRKGWLMARSRGGIGWTEDSGCASARWKPRCRSMLMASGRGREGAASPAGRLSPQPRYSFLTPLLLLFSRSVVSDSLRPHGPQHARLPCPPPTPGVYSDSCPLRCHPAISSSVIPFSSHLQSFPASGSFPMSQFFASGGPSIGVSASASVLPVNLQD